VAGLARAIDDAQTAAGNGHGPGRLFAPMTVEQLTVEAVLDDAIGVAGLLPARMGEPARMLLTGATGFLGAFLLHDLLRATTAAVYCLVRAASPAAARQRLRQNLSAYGLWDQASADRIVPVLGDLAQTDLGLGPAGFAALADSIDVIYHNGAMVNFVHGYAAHKPTNVDGTRAMLRLAATRRIKPVHFVSTLSVFHTGRQAAGRAFREDDDLEATGVPYGGYAQSKWVSERLVAQAGARGLPVATYRPGPISGHSRTGAWNTDDFIAGLTQVCLAINAVPHLELSADFVPVDYVSSAIVALSRRPESVGQVFHLSHPQPMPLGRLIEWARGRGYPLRTLSFEAWQAELLSLASRFPASVSSPFLPLIEDVTRDQVFMPHFECQNTLAGLAGSGVACPPLDATLLDRYLDYLARNGLVPRPAGPDARAASGYPAVEAESQLA
jgi:thioester reductase-like protein